ncbi:AraC family transcriptional regulator [Enterovibrio norvegicus]|uniref:AraC family transcriptional regulator n=1 Tax=Enterovibrio norvegicus TaxID=188144 RepID=UPI00354D8342
MTYLDKIQIGVDFIEANLGNDIQLNNVAKTAGLSQWHFQRIFKALTGETLKTYIRNRRLSCSLLSLEVNDNRILDIALEAGFESQEAYTRAFKSLFGVTPNQYRQIEGKKRWLKKIQFTPDYLRHLNQQVKLKPEIIEQKAMMLVGLRTTFYGSDSDKNNISQTLPALWDAFLPRIKEIQCRNDPYVAYGVVQPTTENTELLEYIAAVEVSSLTNIPDGLTAVSIAASRYAKFSHRGKPTQLDSTVNFIYSTWLMGATYTHTQGPDIETYGREYQPNSDESVIYYSLPIQE